MRDSRRLGMPILVMLISTILFYLLQTYIHTNWMQMMITILSDVSLFVFGMMLNAKKRSHCVFRKVIALVLSIILLCIQIGAVSLPFVATLKDFLQINPYLLSMLFSYFGFLFMD